MNNESKYISIIARCMTVAFIGCLICTVFIFSKLSQARENDIYEKKYVYVEVTSHIPTANDQPEEKTLFIVKEYFGQIGIFDADGSLINVIEIYTKTLPEVDRILLREGIELSSKEALDALIEDYSS